MKQHSQFDSEEEHRHQAAEHQVQPATAREFGSVEEMLRHDALHTPVPPNVAHRLQESLAQVPPAPRPWWRRWFGGA